MALVAYNNALNSELVEEILENWIDETYHSIFEPKEFGRFDYKIDCVMTTNPKYENRYYNKMFRDVFDFKFSDYTSEEIQSYHWDPDMPCWYRYYLSFTDSRNIHDLKSYLDYNDDDNDDNEDALKYENVYSVMHSQFIEATMMLI